MLLLFLFVHLRFYTISRNLNNFFDYLLHDRWVHHGRSLRSFEHPDVITRLHGPANTRMSDFPAPFQNDRINRPNGAKFEILFEEKKYLRRKNKKKRNGENNNVNYY
jgi:hypothetical protein